MSTIYFVIPAFVKNRPSIAIHNEDYLYESLEKLECKILIEDDFFEKLDHYRDLSFKGCKFIFQGFTFFHIVPSLHKNNFFNFEHSCSVPEFDKVTNKIASLNKESKFYFSWDTWTPDSMSHLRDVDFCKKSKIKNFIVPYSKQRPESIELTKQGFELFTWLSSCKTSFANKYDNIGLNKKIPGLIVSGNVTESYVYPTRHRIMSFIAKCSEMKSPFVNFKELKVGLLPHPGYERKSDTIVGERYTDVLSQWAFGLTCTAGWRQCLLAKHVEIAIANSLPVSDSLAEYDVPKEINECMVLADFRRKPKDVFDEMSYLLKNENEYNERRKRYRDYMLSNRSTDRNTKKLIQQIRAIKLKN